MPTNSEKIEQLIRDTVRAESTTGERLDAMKAELARMGDELRRHQHLLETLATRMAVTEQRCAALEKNTDRAWQLAPLVLSGIALLASLVVALVKK